MASHTTDTNPGFDHAITYTTRNKVGVPLRKITALTVRERVRFPGKLGIRLHQTCHDHATDMVRGFISITSAVGQDDDGEKPFVT